MLPLRSYGDSDRSEVDVVADLGSFAVRGDGGGGLPRWLDYASHL